MEAKNAVIGPTTLEIVSRTPKVLRALAAGMELAPSSPDDWGMAEVMAHLVDVEAIGIMTRLRRIVEEENPFIQSIDPSARLKTDGVAGRELEGLLAELEARRAEDVAFVRDLSAEQLARTGTHDAAGTIAAADVVNWWAYHDLVHVRQAMAWLQRGVRPYLGATEAFREED